MDRLFVYAVVPASFWFFSGSIIAWTPLESEATVYMLSCDGAQVGGVCNGKEEADLPFTYKVSVDEHAVLYSRMDGPDILRRLPFCTIRDARDWLCQWEGDKIPKSRFGMVAGKYVEIATCTSDATREMFYQVPMWRWWLVWLREKLF